MTEQVPAVQLFYAEADDLLCKIPDKSVKLIFTDPPWDTGTLRQPSDNNPLYSYSDRFDGDDFEMLIRALFVQAQRILTKDGTLCIWMGRDRTHEVGYWGKQYLYHVGDVVVQMELGNPGKSAWPQKHGTILMFARGKKDQYFDVSELPMEERRGSHNVEYQEYRRSSSVLRATLANNDSQRTGYPDQKPQWVVETFIKCHTRPGDLIVDPFGGSGTTAFASQLVKGRHCITGDRNEGAIRVMRLRLGVDPQELME